MLSAAAGLDVGGVAVLNSALPSLGAHFGTSAQDLSWAVTGYALAFAGLLSCGGALADRLRRRGVLVWGLAALAAGAVLALTAASFWTVAAGRVLQGAGAAVTLPAATALLTSAYPEGPERARALGVFSAAQAACYGAGLVAGGVVTGALGWRWVFALQALAAVGIALAALRALPAGARTHRPGPDPTGALALPVALVLTVLGADTAARPGGALPAAALFAAACGAGLLWWRRGRAGAGRPALLDPGLLRRRGVRIAAVVAAAFYFCVTGSLFLLPLHLQRTLGMSPAASGLAVLPVSLAVAGAALLSGRLMRTRGPRPPLVLGLLLTAGGVLLWCAAGPGTPYAGPVLIGLLVTGVGQGLVFPALTAVGLRDVPGHDHGSASALTGTALQIGSAVGPTVLAGIAQAWTSATTATAIVRGGGAIPDPGALSPSGLHAAWAAAAGLLLLVALPAVARLGTRPRHR
ncbi:MFS transporter (plasmid) [Streptomyces sp. BI20]|uniref:MFS transporter n=1 Tax=Streptomyces sp. BI20 TaxID=3403460 RepID=UPI003C761920